MLADGGLVHPRLLAEAVAGARAAGRALSDEIVHRALLGRGELLAALGAAWGLPVVDPAAVGPDLAAQWKLPQDFVDLRLVYPLRYAESELDCAVAGPDPEVLEEAERLSGAVVRLHLALPSEIRRWIDVLRLG